MPMKTYKGTCHCGAVKFEADIDLSQGSNRCNCSYCAKARVWFAFAQGEKAFRVLDDKAATQYRWTPPGASGAHLTYNFCGTCGIRTYAQGNMESLGGIFHAVHIPTLDLSTEELAKIPVQYVNGRDGSYGKVTEHTETI